MSKPSQPERPWHEPGKWLVNPAYWDAEALAARPRMRSRIQFIDCTVSALSGDWKSLIDRHIDLGTEVISPTGTRRKASAIWKAARTRKRR